MNTVARLIVGLMVLGSLNAYAQQPPAQTPPAAAVNAPVEVGNKICPVSKEKVGENGMEPHKITYNGKVYNLCCGMCEKDFNKDPGKYAKIADDEVAQEAAQGK